MVDVGLKDVFFMTSVYNMPVFWDSVTPFSDKFTTTRCLYSVNMTVRISTEIYEHNYYNHVVDNGKLTTLDVLNNYY